MVFTKISAVVRTQWRLLRSTLDGENHEHRVQQRQAKNHIKQQRQAKNHIKQQRKAARRAARVARRAARAARRAQRKQRHTLLSPTAVGEPTDDEKRPMTIAKCKEPRISAAPGGLVWTRTAEELIDGTGSEPNGRRRNTFWPLQEECPECVDEKSAVTDVTSLTVVKAIKAVPQLSIKLALDIEAQLEQNPREFYNSLGGYSTVDEEDDELLPAVLVGGRHTCDDKLPSKWTVVGLKKPASLPCSKAVLRKETEQEEATGSRTLLSMAASSIAASKHRPKSLTISSEVVEMKPEDENVNVHESAAFGGCNTFDREKDSQGLFLNNPGINGLYDPHSDNLFTQCDGEASITDLDTKIHPNWCDVGQDVNVKSEDENKTSVERFIDADLNEAVVPKLIVPEELLTKEPPRMHNFLDEHMLEADRPLYANDNLSEKEAVWNEPRKVVDESKGSEVVEEVDMELQGMSKDVEIVDQKVMDKEVELQYPADKDMLNQEASFPGSPFQSGTLPRGIYSPGTMDEYSCSIYESLLTREHRYHVTENIFAKQQSIRPRMRAVLVDWLVEVHQRFELEAQTLYLTVNYVDRYLAQTSVNPQRFQLLGVAALLIASKFEEIYPCDMDDLLYICERSYSKTDLVDCERDLLNVFKFNLAVPSVSSFLGYYLEHFEEEDKLIGQLANYFAECSLLDFTFGATYEPSIVACACLLAAYCYIENQAPSLVWNYRLVELTGYAVEVIVPCTQNLSSILIQPTELTAVATKYSGNEFGEVAQLLLDDLEVLLCYH